MSPTAPEDIVLASEAVGDIHAVLHLGGREGYETLLNTDLSRELDQLGRFLN